MPAKIDDRTVKPLRYVLAAAGFLVLVAIATLIANGRVDVAAVDLLVVSWVAGPLIGLAFLIWFVTTLNSIARSLREQTRIARHTARQLELLVAREGAATRS
ncbi:hypothetical protein [Saccharothrix sp. Mg75]|uniref:hypothetical protein n=1 Tax=Saccharothrix sp. Mg75 TaxID=3445357 RepID=UPI003EE958AB